MAGINRHVERVHQAGVMGKFKMFLRRPCRPSKGWSGPILAFHPSTGGTRHGSLWRLLLVLVTFVGLSQIGGGDSSSKSGFPPHLRHLLSPLSFSSAWAQTLILPPAQQQFADSNGKPLAGGSVFFYIPGTSTPKTTWQDINATVPNTNPVILNSAGRAQIWGQGNYREVVFDVNSNLIWDQLTSAVQFQTSVIGIGSWTASDLLCSNTTTSSVYVAKDCNSLIPSGYVAGNGVGLQTFSINGGTSGNGNGPTLLIQGNGATQGNLGFSSARSGAAFSNDIELFALNGVRIVGTSPTTLSCASLATSANGQVSCAVNGAVLSIPLSNPAGTASTTGVMMGLGGVCTLTPVKTTRIAVSIAGNIAATNQFQSGGIQLKFGTGVAPGNGVAFTGTTLANQGVTNPQSTGGPIVVPFNIQAVATSLAVGTAYWFDLTAFTSAGVGTLVETSLTCNLIEL
jgi:hypothetical protein